MNQLNVNFKSLINTNENIGGPSSGKEVEFDPERTINQAFQKSADDGFTALFRLYYGLLCNHALRFVFSKETAEDIVSDIFLEFHSKELYKNIQKSFRAYLFTSVRRRSFDHVRSKLHEQTSLESVPDLSTNDSQSPESITQYEDLCGDIQQTIDSMPIKRRQIYLMTNFDGKKSGEIAEELSISKRTVEAHLHQAFKQLRDSLRGKWTIILFWLIQI